MRQRTTSTAETQTVIKCPGKCKMWTSSEMNAEEMGYRYSYTLTKISIKLFWDWPNVVLFSVWLMDKRKRTHGPFQTGTEHHLSKPPYYPTHRCGRHIEKYRELTDAGMAVDPWPCSRNIFRTQPNISRRWPKPISIRPKCVRQRALLRLVAGCWFCATHIRPDKLQAFRPFYLLFYI